MPQKIKDFALFYFLSFIFIFFIHHIFRDDWFFYTDLPTMIMYLSRAALSVGIVLYLVLLLTRVDIARFVTKAFAFMMLFVLADGVIRIFRWNFKAEFAAWLVVIGLLAWKLPSRFQTVDFARAYKILVRLSAALIFAALVANIAGAVTGETAQNPKRLMLIVMDGMSARFLQSKSIQSPEHPFNKLLDRAVVFDNFHTNRGWTEAFFGTLYRGDLNLKNNSKQLFSELEKAGVEVHLNTFHTNGIPEATHLSYYQGLRSYFYTQNYVWIPRALGLNTHVYRYLNQKTTQKLNSRTAFIINATNFGFEENSPFAGELQREYELALKSRANKSHFFLLHVNKYGNVPYPEGNELWEVVFQNKSQSENRKLLSYLDGNERRYTPELESQVRDLRRDSDEKVFKALSLLAPVIEDLISDPNLTVMVTSDHGTMYEDGKVFYGYHPEEGVLRVPLILLGRGLASTVNANAYDTLDLNASIKSYFGIQAPNGQSILSPEYRPKVILNLALRNNKKNKELFLSVYDGKKKTVLNLHPESTREKYTCEVNELQCEKGQFQPLSNEVLGRYLSAFGEPDGAGSVRK